MAERLIWKLGMTRDFLKSLPDEEIVNELIKMGVDEEMLGQLDHEGLIGLLDDMDDLDDEDLKDFDLKIVPMIRNQTGDSGMVMMVSSDRVIPTYAETLVDGIYPLRYLEGEIIDDGRGLTLRADDGVEYKLYAIPDDSIDFMNFVNECLPDFISDNVNDLMEADEYLDDDMAYNEVINNLPQLIDDEDVIKDYAYIPAFEDNRKRVVNELTTNESLGESMSDLEKLDSFLGIDYVDESLAESLPAEVKVPDNFDFEKGGEEEFFKNKFGKVPVDWDVKPTTEGNKFINIKWGVDEDLTEGDKKFKSVMSSDFLSNKLGREFLKNHPTRRELAQELCNVYYGGGDIDEVPWNIASQCYTSAIELLDNDESLNEDADEYYVLSTSDRGGNSDYIKGPMTKEEATEYAKISRKNASKYYREKYLVYPKNRIPGRYKHLLDNESLQESISLDQADREKLVDELSQIKSMDRNKLYDLDLLTTDLSDGSVEELFPVTTKLIVSFLSEMANITKEELADKDQINIWWTDGDLFDDRDWEALFNGADKLINGKKRVLWKVYYSPYLDEDLNSDVYNALSDVAYDYEVNKLEPVYVDDFEEAEKNFNDKYFDGLTRDDYDDSLEEECKDESLSDKEINEPVNESLIEELSRLDVKDSDYLRGQLKDLENDLMNKAQEASYAGAKKLSRILQKFLDMLDDYDEILVESLSTDLQNKIKEICDVMIANLEKEDLEYIIEEPPYSEDGILSNDDLADLDGDESEIAEFAINYIKSKI